MALIKCPECRSSISNRAESCPKCGYPIIGRGTTQVHGGEIKIIEQTAKGRKHRLWLALLVVAALMFPLWFGIILIVLWVGAFIPVSQDFSRSLLRLNPSEKWRSFFRLTMYGLVGLVLIYVGWLSAEHKAEQERMAAKQVAKKAEQRRLANEADAKVEALVVDATNAVKADDIDAAIEKIKVALAIPHANALTNARKLDQQIGNATNSTRIQAALMKLSDEDFQQLKDKGTIPTQMVSGYEGLDRRIAEFARIHVKQVAEARENRRLAQLEANNKKQEEARLAAETARKNDEARQAQEEIRREATQKEVKDHLDAYVAFLNTADIKIIKYVSIQRNGDDWEATLTVDNLWHIRHYQIRLQDAQTLWKAWAIIASSKEPDKARIKLIDLSGNEVGGSRVWGGSLIWVKEY